MIDCDVHNTWSSVAELRSYLAPAFRDWFDRGEVPGARPSFPAAHRPWLHPEDFKRADSVPDGGGSAGSDYELMCAQLLDRYGVDYAVPTGDEPIEVSTLANPYYAQALAAAYNDYLLDVWPVTRACAAPWWLRLRILRVPPARSAALAAASGSFRFLSPAERSVPMAIRSITRSGTPARS
jgi:hypothetical protein